MEQKQKEKIIKYVEFVLEPINGKFSDFANSHDIYVSIGPMGNHSNIFSEENKITVYPVKIKTDFGEITMNFWSDQLDDPRWSVVEGCAYNKAIIPDKNWQEINKKISDLYMKNI